MADELNTSGTRSMDDMPDDRDMPDDTPRVAALGDLGDFQVAEGFPDPRGWDVISSGGKKIGKVHDLIVDTGEMRTRYLDVKLDGDAIGASSDHDVLLPVGVAQLDDANDNVVLGSLTEAQLAALPEFTHGEISRDYESAVLSQMPGRGEAAAATGADYYATHHFDDAAFFGSRERANRELNGEIGSSAASETRVWKEKIDIDRSREREVSGDENNRTGAA